MRLPLILSACLLALPLYAATEAPASSGHLPPPPLDNHGDTGMGNTPPPGDLTENANPPAPPAELGGKMPVSHDALPPPGMNGPAPSHP